MLICLSGGYLFVVLADDFATSGGHTFCLFKRITGIACPGCGMGRASLLMLHGEVAASLAMNPLAIPFFAACLALAGWFVADLVRGRRGAWDFLTTPFPTKWFVLLLVVLTANWIWSICKGL